MNLHNRLLNLFILNHKVHIKKGYNFNMVNDDDMYSFQFEDYCLTITPFESKQKVVISEEQSYGLFPLKMFYNKEGHYIK